MAESTEVNESLIRMLHRLIDLCHDSEGIFAEAADRTPSPELQSAFRDLAAARREMVEELKSHLVLAGSTVTERGTVPGKIELLYARIEDALGTQDLPDLLDHVVAVESRAGEEFENALQAGDVPETLRSNLRRMRGTIRLSKNTFRRLKGHES